MCTGPSKVCHMASVQSLGQRMQIDFSARVRMLFVHVNAYRAFQSLPYGFSSKFRSEDAN